MCSANFLVAALVSFSGVIFGCAGHSAPGWVHGNAVVDGQTAAWSADLHTLSTAGDLSAYTQGYPNGFDFQLDAHPLPTFAVGDYDLSQNAKTQTPAVEATLHFPLASGGFADGDASAGTVHTDHLPTTGEPYWSGSLSNVQCDLVYAPCVGTEGCPNPPDHHVLVMNATFNVTYDADGIAAFYSH